MCQTSSARRAATVRQKRPAGRFSLVELLVVVAVIAILTGLLLPALKKAKDVAKAIHCVNNLKQAGVGMTMCADDHNDYLPNSMWTWTGGVVFGAEFGATLWLDVLYPYISSGKLPATLTANTRLAQNLICPGRPDVRWKLASTQTPVTNYMYNDFIGNISTPSTAPSRRLSRCPFPGKAMIMGDAYTYPCIQDFWSYQILGNHKRFTNFLFVDGHAEQSDVARQGPSSTAVPALKSYWRFESSGWQ